MMKSRCWLVVLMGLLTMTSVRAQDGTEAAFRRWALTPPMGWNSWDCYYSTVNEELTLQNARYLRDHLKQYGWEYVVVDIRWYANHPSLGGGNYNQQGTQDCQLDEYGRYVPSPTRFPSAMVNGKNEGFKALADSIHAMGLKFGIHIMRGLPKYILNDRTAYRLKGDESITGTRWSQVYSSATPACTWLKDNLTVRNNTYGQLYYNSIVDLYASWGVDFIKVDDMSRPFYTDEIKMLRNAIDQCGRPIVLSLSPGKTQYSYAESCLENANMWRMMDDLWDNWSSVKAVFNEANAWQPYYRPGNYADCDMLPLGRISMTVADAGYANADGGRYTALTHNEQTLLMTLWGICHSPLFFGGELTENDEFTHSLLTNEEYLRMHAYGVDAHQAKNENGQIVWTSIDPATGDRYLALFQSDAGNGWIYDDGALYTSQVLAYTTDGHKEDVDITFPKGIKSLALVWDDGGDNYNYDHGDWLNPTFISENGYEVPVTGSFVYSRYTNSYYNVIRENVNVLNTGKMKVLGTTYDRGFSADANAILQVMVPDSIVGFKATVALDDTGIGQTNSTTTMRFYVFDSDPRVSLTNSAYTAVAHTGRITRSNNQPVELEADITGASTLTIVVDACGDGFSYDRADMVNPVLIDADGNETSLLGLTEKSYTSDWSTLHKNVNVEGGPLVMAGTTYATGLGLNAACTLVYDLPAAKQFVKFRALCGLDDSVIADNSSDSGSTIQFLVSADNTSNAFGVNLEDFGYQADQKVAFYDIWNQTDAGTWQGSEFSTEVPSHGARLYRLTPQRTGSTSVSVSATAQNDSVWLITADITGGTDAQSYVQFYIDGKPVGSVKADGGSVAYLAQGLGDGEHTAYAAYGGTVESAGSTSETITFSVATGIAAVWNPAQGHIAVGSDGTRTILAAESGMPLRIYAASGTLVTSAHTDASGQLSVQLPAGVYVASTGQRSQTFLVK